MSKSGSPSTVLRPTAQFDLLPPPEYHSDPAVVARGRRGFPRWFPGATLYFYTVVARAMRDAARRTRTEEGLTDTFFVSRSNDLLRTAERCGTEVHVTGLDRVQTQCGSGPVVFVGNHMSTLETFTLPGVLLPLTKLTFVLKEELMGYPLLGRILQTLEPVTVTRGDPRADLKKVLTGGEEQLRKGRSVVIFPQTTRSTCFDPSAFNTLGVKLAARVGVPAMPLALRTDFWSPGRFIKDFGPIRPNNNIHFAFGPPIEVTKATSRSAHEEVVAFLRTHLSSWGVPVDDDGAREAARAPKR